MVKRKITFKAIISPKDAYFILKKSGIFDKVVVDNRPKCPKCGTQETRKKGFSTRVSGERVQRFQCNICNRKFLEILNI